MVRDGALGELLLFVFFFLSLRGSSRPAWIVDVG